MSSGSRSSPSKEFLIASTAKDKKSKEPWIRLALQLALDPQIKLLQSVSMEDINHSDLTFNNEGKLHLGSLRSRAVIFHAASAEILKVISRNASGEIIRHVVATVGAKRFNLPLLGGSAARTQAATAEALSA